LNPSFLIKSRTRVATTLPQVETLQKLKHSIFEITGRLVGTRGQEDSAVGLATRASSRPARDDPKNKNRERKLFIR